MSLERINLNVPVAARKRLRAVARRLGRTESEVARDLLLEALARTEREEFYERVIGEITPAARDRLLQIYEAFERLDAPR